ncbi:MAG TPA: glycosyltransferase family 39 protein, partial [bacterium]|nr:glycosyltransferase family 39 protein [bacterium]
MTTEDTSPKKTLTKIGLSLFIVFFTFIIYSNTLHNPFVYDDRIIISGNPALNDISKVKVIFSKDYFRVTGERSYRPVSTALLFIESALGGGEPFAFHVTGIAVHALNGVLIFLIAGFLFGGTALPLFSALLFTAHPIQAEAVNVMSFIEDPLSTLFLLGSVYLYLLSGKARLKAIPYAASLCFALAAMLSKESAAVLPAVVLLTALLFRDKNDPRSWKKDVLKYSGILLSFAIFI